MTSAPVPPPNSIGSSPAMVALDGTGAPHVLYNTYRSPRRHAKYIRGPFAWPLDPLSIVQVQ